MQIDVAHTAAAVVATLAPFTPLLVQAGKFTGKALAEMVVQKGGEQAWNKAQSIWAKLSGHADQDNDFQDAATMLARRPEDKPRQEMLAEIVANYLQEDPALANDLFGLLGGGKAVQEVLADKNSLVMAVTQSLKGTGSQTVRASNGSAIIGVNQTND